ncbi:MAG: 23S rRNA pseudouridine(1911/1915/1917) synthase RluD [Pseudomonadota bacterium]
MPSHDPPSERLQLVVPDSAAGSRLDRLLAAQTDLSRSRIQRLMRSGDVRVDDAIVSAKFKVRGGESVEIGVRAEAAVDHAPDPSVVLNVVHEDEDVLVVNKAAGLVMHPAPGALDGTVLNGLLALDPALGTLPRAGIVHRLDKDTTGLFVVARSARAQASLTAQLQARTVSRRYQAVVVGTPVAGGTCEEPIGRHPVDRKRMAVRKGGREAVTHYRVARRFKAHTLLDVRLETGRTHQIRVHMAHLRLPLVGDPVYGGRLRMPAGAGDELQACIRAFSRQALHAAELAFLHPSDNQQRCYQCPMPDDMQVLVDTLEADAERSP